jgi:hypothetical protein
MARRPNKHRPRTKSSGRKGGERSAFAPSGGGEVRRTAALRASILGTAAPSESALPMRPLERLAQAYGVEMAEVRRFTRSTLAAPDDPARDARVAELARQIAEGSYSVDPDLLLEAAESRAAEESPAVVSMASRNTRKDLA